MVINKIFGALLFMVGAYLLFGIWFAKEGEYEILTIEIIGSTLMIYFGLKIMHFF